MKKLLILSLFFIPLFSMENRVVPVDGALSAEPSDVRVQELKECPICTEVIDPGQRLGCTHTFHQQCLEGWKKHQESKDLVPTCPTCRQHFSPSTVDMATQTEDTGTQADPSQSFIFACCSLAKGKKRCANLSNWCCSCYWCCDYIRDELEEIKCCSGETCCDKLCEGCYDPTCGIFTAILCSDHGLLCPQCCLKKFKCFWNEEKKTFCGCTTQCRNLTRLCLLFPIMANNCLSMEGDRDTLPPTCPWIFPNRDEHEPHRPPQKDCGLGWPACWCKKETSDDA